MSDSPSRPPRSARPKTPEDRLDFLDRELKTIKEGMVSLGTKEQVDGLLDSVKKINGEIERVLNRKSSLGRIWEWFWKERNWSIPTSVGIGLAIISALGASLHFALDVLIDHHLSATNTSVSDLGKRIDRIETMNSLHAANEIIRDVKSLPVEAIKQHGSQLVSAKQSISLLTDQGAPDYWPTALSLVRLASIAQSSAPANFSLANASHVQQVTGINFNARGTYILKGPINNCIFHSAVIVFDPDVILRGDLFIDCIFLLPTDVVNPTPKIKGIGQQLLNAENLEQVRLSIG